MKKVIRLTERDLTRIVKRIIKEESSPTGDSTPKLKEVALSYMKNSGINTNYYVDGSAVPTEEGFRYIFRIWKKSHTLPQELTSDIEKKTENIEELTSILKDRIEGGEFSNFDRGPGKLYVRTELIYMGEINNDYEFMVEVEEGYNEREEHTMSDTVSERIIRLTERDLTRIVKRVIRENEEDSDDDDGGYYTFDFGGPKDLTALIEGITDLIDNSEDVNDFEMKLEQFTNDNQKDFNELTDDDRNRLDRFINSVITRYDFN